MKSSSSTDAPDVSAPSVDGADARAATTERRDGGASRGERRTFCNEPWLGVLSISIEKDVSFCPCFLKLHLGNLGESTLQELWNAEPLVEIRRAFAEGRLADACRGQLCAPALGTHSYLTEVPDLGAVADDADPLAKPDAGN